MSDDSIYDTAFVCSLFDEMAATYGLMNLLSSFGFTVMWRRKCARNLDVRADAVVVDLMTGMGELCTELKRSLDESGHLIALDISPVMCKRAKSHQFRCAYDVVEADALSCPIDDSSVDYVFSSFGLKTFNDEQLDALASEVSRILKSGGEFSFLEVSVPPNALLRLPYMFYLQRVVPILGRLFLGNPENYRMLGVYTSAFGNCDIVASLFEKHGLAVARSKYFFGCATGITGCK